VNWLLLVPVLAAAAYQLLALAGAIRHLLQEEPPAGELPPVSILKPVRGLDPHFRQAALTHINQDYPDFEVLFGAEDAGDPALAEARSLMAEAPPGRGILFSWSLTATFACRPAICAGLLRRWAIRMWAWSPVCMEGSRTIGRGAGRRWDSPPISP
jgi:hypothetical protein